MQPVSSLEQGASGPARAATTSSAAATSVTNGLIIGTNDLFITSVETSCSLRSNLNHNLESGRKQHSINPYLDRMTISSVEIYIVDSFMIMTQ